MQVLLLLATILLRASFSICCHSFKDTNTTLSTQSGETYHATITGCLERQQFEATIVMIHVAKQKVPKLEKDSVRHLRQLLSISFSECQMEVVEADAFRDVPRLRELRIVRNELTEVVKGAFSGLDQLNILDLSRNKIERIENGAVGNSATLKEVYLGFNQLQVWVAEWFDNATNIKVIDLQHNKIKVVPERAFHILPKIEKICFDFNELEVVHSEAFAGITHLRFLGLRYNNLRSIDPKTFPNRIIIDDLRIDANYLNFLPARFLATVEVRRLTFSGNPWKCPCSDQISSWLYQTNGTVRESEYCQGRNMPVCGFPSTFPDTCKETTDDEVTRKYLRKLKMIEPPLNQYCARLDGF